MGPEGFTGPELQFCKRKEFWDEFQRLMVRMVLMVTECEWISCPRIVCFKLAKMVPFTLHVCILLQSKQNRTKCDTQTKIKGHRLDEDEQSHGPRS